MHIFLILLFLFLIVFLFFNELYKNTNFFKNQIIQIEKFKDVPSGLEIVNTGSSYARYAFDYNGTGLKGFNFALMPQSLTYDFKILKQFSNKFKKRCIVLITLPDLVFGFLDYKNDTHNTNYYYFLEKKYINNYNIFKYIVRILFPVLSSRFSIRYIFKDIPKNNSFEQTNNFMSYQQVAIDAQSRVTSWIKEFNLKNTTDCKFSSDLHATFEKTTNLLRGIIDYCLKNDFRPVLITPPNSKIILDLMSKEFIKSFLYDNVAKANTQNIPYFDYLYDERFQDYKLYINSDMLNKKGRELFTSIVIEDLNKIGYITK